MCRRGQPQGAASAPVSLPWRWALRHLQGPTHTALGSLGPRWGSSASKVPALMLHTSLPGLGDQERAPVQGKSSRGLRGHGHRRRRGVLESRQREAEGNSRQRGGRERRRAGCWHRLQRSHGHCWFCPPRGPQGQPGGEPEPSGRGQRPHGAGRAAEPVTLTRGLGSSEVKSPLCSTDVLSTAGCTRGPEA